MLDFKVGQVIPFPSRVSMTTFYIYEIRNKTDPGRKYVGVTNDPLQRFRAHQSTGGNLSRAMEDLGPDNFEMEILEVCTQGKLHAGLREEYWMKERGAMFPVGYNRHSRSSYVRASSLPAKDRRQRKRDAKEEQKRQEKLWKLYSVEAD
jgi:predicted GIY-YIG superfamily endonuclease